MALLPVGMRERNPTPCSTLTAFTTAHTVSAAHQGLNLV
jgi:hypothetical protein